MRELKIRSAYARIYVRTYIYLRYTYDGPKRYGGERVGYLSWDSKQTAPMQMSRYNRGQHVNHLSRLTFCFCRPDFLARATIVIFGRLRSRARCGEGPKEVYAQNSEPSSRERSSHDARAARQISCISPRRADIANTSRLAVHAPVDH